MAARYLADIDGSFMTRGRPQSRTNSPRSIIVSKGDSG
jgi:hypothetical protein